MSTRRSHAGVAAALATLTRVAIQRGDVALARVRLIECLAAVNPRDTQHPLGTAIQAAAEIAYATGDLNRAVEFCGAAERILRRLGNAPAAGPRFGLPDKLRDQMGSERFVAAWAASRATPFPVEFYTSRVLQWLEQLALPHRHGAERDGSALDSAHDGTQGSTIALIDRARYGSASAAEDLAARHLPPLQRFAHGRVPERARGHLDTSDFVQETMIRGLAKLDAIKDRRKGSFFEYLKRVLINQMLDEVRRASRRPRATDLDELIPANTPTPLEDLVDREVLHSFRDALLRLPRRQREAIVLRVLEGRTYQEVADAIGSPSANAARMLVCRGLALVTKWLGKS